MDFQQKPKPITKALSLRRDHLESIPEQITKLYAQFSHSQVGRKAKSKIKDKR